MPSRAKSWSFHCSLWERALTLGVRPQADRAWGRPGHFLIYLRGDSDHTTRLQQDCGSENQQRQCFSMRPTGLSRPAGIQGLSASPPPHDSVERLLLQSVRQGHTHPNESHILLACVNSTPRPSDSMSHCVNLLLKSALNCLGTLDLDGSASVESPC